MEPSRRPPKPHALVLRNLRHVRLPLVHSPRPSRRSGPTYHCPRLRGPCGRRRQGALCCLQHPAYAPDGVARSRQSGVGLRLGKPAGPLRVPYHAQYRPPPLQQPRRPGRHATLQPGAVHVTRCHPFWPGLPLARAHQGRKRAPPGPRAKQVHGRTRGSCQPPPRQGGRFHPHPLPPRTVPPTRPLGNSATQSSRGVTATRPTPSRTLPPSNR